jgi:hypothetical protein
VAEPISKQVLSLWIAAYVAMVMTVVVGMFVARANILSEMSTPTATEEWNRWRAAAAEQDGTHGPVQRTVPKSNVPPLLLLMRDYFPASLVGALLPLSALFWFIAWLIHGVTQQSRARSQAMHGDHAKK